MLEKKKIKKKKKTGYRSGVSGKDLYLLVMEN
jgi:hypothetical protein